MRSPSPADHHAAANGDPRWASDSVGPRDARVARDLSGVRAGRSERGSVTAEFALVIPAVIVVLGCCLGAFQLATAQLRLENAAAVAARTMARGGDAAAVATRAGEVSAGVRVQRQDRGDVVCAVASASGGLGLLGPVALSATSCSLAGGL